MVENAKFIEVDAGVRYWEDATVNGIDDDDGSRIPLRVRGRWRPVIELSSGNIQNWPEGTEATIHYKVCDDGEYWLQNAEGRRIAKYESPYVPSILSVGDSGFGDYIIFSIGGNGQIVSWIPPYLDSEHWEAMP